MFTQHDTNAADAAADAARHLMDVSGNDYLDADATLTWLRREHPTAKIITTMLSEQAIHAYVIERTNAKTGRTYREFADSPDPSAAMVETRQAVFSAELVIDSEIVARGHGSASRLTFASYLEKAESIAVRRMCINAGFSLEMLRQLGFELRKAPPNRSAPTWNAQASSTRPPAESAPQAAAAAAPTPIQPTPPSPDPDPAPVSPPAESATQASRWAHLVWSGEMATSNASPDTAVGCIQAVPVVTRKIWRKTIADAFDQNPNDDYEKVIGLLGPLAGAEVWKWIILAKTASNSGQLNRVLAQSRMNSQKIGGRAWSAATQEIAQSFAPH